MNSREQRLERMVLKAREGQEQLFIGLITGEKNGKWETVVNGRTTKRPEIAETDFGLNFQGHGIGDEVFVLTSEHNDMPKIVGLSNYILHGETVEV